MTFGADALKLDVVEYDKARGIGLLLGFFLFLSLSLSLSVV